MRHNANFLDISKGAKVQAEGMTYEIVSTTSAQAVLARSLADNSFKTLRVDVLQPANAGEKAAGPRFDLIADAPEYQIAEQRFQAIQPLLGEMVRHTSDVERIGASFGVSVRTIYDWIKRYEDSPQLSSLIPNKRGPTPGQNTLDPRLDAIINDAIKRNHTIPQRKRVARVIEAVLDACRIAEVKPPHVNTVRERVKALPRAAVLRSQGRTDEANALKPVLGQFPGADAPLSVVQMDHSESDVVIVDDAMRLPLGRPWVTVAMDVHTRMIVGLVVSMETPSAFAAGRCIAHAMQPKDKYLERLGVTGDWPAYGQPGVVHMDNAKEFRGEVLKAAFAKYEIGHQFRKVKTPHYGGHIERLMRTLSEAIRNLPGATFSNPKERIGYDSDARAAMTFAEFETWLVDYVVNIYHQQSHAELDDTPPIAKWREGIEKIGLPWPPRDPEELRLDFLPFQKRTVGRRGILIDHMHYWNDGLRNWIESSDPDHQTLKRKFLVRLDPRDITRVWFLDPISNAYVLTPTLDTTRPAVSRWEWVAVKRAAKAEGKSKVDEQTLFEARQRLIDGASNAVAKTKTARRIQQRALDTERHANASRTEQPTGRTPKPTISGPSLPSPQAEPSTFDLPVEPYEDIEA